MTGAYSGGFVGHIDLCTAHDLSRYMRFSVEDQPIGWITPEAAAVASAAAASLSVDKTTGLMLRGGDFETRSAALAQAARALDEHFTIGLRGEMYPVIAAWGDTPLARLDRGAVPWFGIPAHGIHANGFVRRHDGIHLWIGERASTLLVDPGKLDNMIGGGMPFGLSPEETLEKEAYEEAGIESALVATARPVGTLSYRHERKGRLRQDTLFLFDLELPDGYVPRGTDGEVAGFRLMPAAEVAEIIRTTDSFKFNCPLVIMDFLVRHDLFPDSPERETVRTRLAGIRTRQ